MRLLEPRDALVVATEHEGRRGEQPEVLRLERLLLLGAEERLLRLEPGATCIGLTAPFELGDPIAHAAPHCAQQPIALESAVR